MVRPRRSTSPRWSFSLVATLALALGCHKTSPPAVPAPLPPPKASATLFDHAMLAGTPARPRPDCSPQALMAAARHVGELELLASGTFKSRARGKRQPAGCPTPESQLVIDEVRGALPDRVSSCMSQDAPFDAEWDMVNSAVMALQACVDCTRANDDRGARCRWVAEQVKRAEQSVKGRLGQ
jgi:hypothetical protein